MQGRFMGFFVGLRWVIESNCISGYFGQTLVHRFSLTYHDPNLPDHDLFLRVKEIAIRRGALVTYAKNRN